MILIKFFIFAAAFFSSAILGVLFFDTLIDFINDLKERFK